MRGIGSGSIRTVLERLGPIAKALVCEGLMILVDFKEYREVDGRKTSVVYNPFETKESFESIIE